MPLAVQEKLYSKFRRVTVTAAQDTQAVLLRKRVQREKWDRERKRGRDEETAQDKTR
jgi:hypothetical protein